ncbi:MAG: threonine--tRNA ligase [Coprobacillus sp.]|nr:threonine--tRNA ligase [Coprobacillus sp.]
MKIVLHDGSIKEVDQNSTEAFNTLNHSTAHLLAEAVLALYPDAKLSIGPSIEEGFYYDIDFGDTPFSEDDLAPIEKKMKEISARGYDIKYMTMTKAAALEYFKDNPYKVELITNLSDGDITAFRQNDFIDLCRGPHVLNSNLIKHFKLTSVAGAYWRGDSHNKQLTRIYGTSHFSEESLQNYLTLVEERRKRDHRVLGKQLDLFMLSEYGPGFPFWLPNGMVIRTEIENLIKEMLRKYDYQLISTPIVLSKELWETSGHWDHYQKNMYLTHVDEREFAIKPMNCPGAILVYNSTLHSYRDLPVRLAELGLDHRHEASGALNGLFRARAFTQDDAHIFCTSAQLRSEITRCVKFFDEVYSLFHLDYTVELSTRPEKDYIGSVSVWNKSEKILEDAIKKTGKPYEINPGDGAFYGPKLDFKVRDSMNRVWQCGTIQLDMNLPHRFGCSYIDASGNKVEPIMIHRACLGSIERFIGVLIEHFAGAFPLWLAPIQIAILPVNNEFHLRYAKSLKTSLEKLGFRVSLDESEEKLGYRMRNAQMKKIPYTIVIGDNEVTNKTLTYRTYKDKEQVTVPVGDFKKKIKIERDQRKLN